MVCSLRYNFWFAHGLHNAGLLTVCTCLHILEVCTRFVYQNICLLIVCTFILKDHPWSPRGGPYSQRPPLVASGRASLPAQLRGCTSPARFVDRALPARTRELIGPHARTPQGPSPAPGPCAPPHPGHDPRLVDHSRTSGAKPTRPWGRRTGELARFRPGLGASATARMHASGQNRGPCTALREHARTREPIGPQSPSPDARTPERPNASGPVPGSGPAHPPASWARSGKGRARRGLKGRGRGEGVIY